MPKFKVRGWVKWTCLNAFLAASLVLLLSRDRPLQVVSDSHQGDPKSSGQNANYSGEDYQRVTFGWRLRQVFDTLASDPSQAPKIYPDCDRECQRAEQDLGAQLDMALWAQMMFWANVAIVIVTGVGVFYVARTLGATATAANAGLEAADAATAANDQARLFFVEQQRARLSVKAVVTKIAWLEREVKITVAMNIKNVGQTNANNVFERVAIFLDPVPPMNKIEAIINENISKSGSFGYTIESQKNISISDTISMDIELIKEWNTIEAKEMDSDFVFIPTLLICCTYNIVFDESVRHTSVIRWIIRKDGKVMRSSGGNLSADEIETQRNLKGDTIAT